MFDLHGKTALVTGSSRGIGRAILLALAAHGAQVILHCRKPCDAGNEVMEKLAAMGAKYHVVYSDLSRIDGARTIADQVAEEMRHSDFVPLAFERSAKISASLSLTATPSEDATAGANL